jgi:anti-sigma regulatory factor (Ser/Thr protein kinase)
MVAWRHIGAGMASGPGSCVRLPHPPTGLERGTQWRRVFPGEARQLGTLRRWLASLLPPGPARDDLVLVATELASNAVCHTASGWDGWFAVEVTLCQSVVRIGVTDSGAPAQPQVIEDPAAERGRGLLLVRALAVRTGVSAAGQGRLVWADVRWDAGRRPEAGRPEPAPGRLAADG